MSQAKGSGIFNAQFAGEFKKHRNRSLAEEARAQEEMRRAYEEAMGYQRPWYDYGQNALTRFQTWEQDPNAITSDPSYQWRLKQGTEALENSAAARGGLLSGNTGRALTDYAQNTASKEYQNEFNRWLQRLGIGQNASSNMSNIAMGRGNALGNLIQRGSENMWKRVVDQSNMTLAGEQATNNIVQSWVPAQYGGGNPGDTVQSTGGGSSGSSGSSGGQYSGPNQQQTTYANDDWLKNSGTTAADWGYY